MNTNGWTKMDELCAAWGGGTDGPPTTETDEPFGWSAEEAREHPASRPGTGREVLWRNEVHVVSPWFRCFCCGWYKDQFFGGDCACGANNWINLEPAPPAPPAPPPSRVMQSGLRALGDEDSPRLRVDQFPGATIATVLEGIGRSMTILLVGAAGVGKSTLAAQAGFVIAQQLGRRLYWLDADQLKWELLEETFLRASCPAERLKGRIIPVCGQHPNGTLDAMGAIAAVPDDGLLVLDSLEAWAPRGDKQALEVLRVLRAHSARVKLVVAATNAAGGVAGDGELERAGDATIFVERTKIRVGKCRWTIGKTWARRGPAGLDVEPLGDEDETAGAPGPAAEPDFSLEAVTLAARSSAREIEAYRARLRAQGVPRDTILGWDRAVEERKAVEARIAAGALPTKRSDGPPLSESIRAAYAKLMQSWPWKGRVRATAIAQALLAPGFEELGAALRELLGTRAGSSLSAAEVGNALKVVRDVSLDGMALTRDLDRKGVAWWCLVNCDSA